MRSVPDLARQLAALDEQRVAFVVTGSVAALVHGAPAEPADLDVVPATDRENLERLGRALAELDARPIAEAGHWERDPFGEWSWITDPEPRPISPLDPDDPATFDHSFETCCGRLDVVPEVAGTYAELRRRARTGRLRGRTTLVAHPVDVLAGMTRSRRAKDAARVRHLRGLAAAPSGVGFVGLRTDRFDEMVAFFGEGIGLEVIREAEGATWFRLGSDAELHVYAADDPDHAFFTTGPVVGLRVADVDDARRRLEAAGTEFLGEVERHGGRSWSHLRAPDGTVIEIID